MSALPNGTTAWSKSSGVGSSLRDRRGISSRQIHLKLGRADPAGAAYHQKIVVTDGAPAFCGGICLAPDDHRDSRRSATARYVYASAQYAKSGSCRKPPLLHPLGVSALDCQGLDLLVDFHCLDPCSRLHHRCCEKEMCRKAFPGRKSPAIFSAFSRRHWPSTSLKKRASWRSSRPMSQTRFQAAAMEIQCRAAVTS